MVNARLPGQCLNPCVVRCLQCERVLNIARQAHEIIETGKKARMVSTLTQKFMAMKDGPRKPQPFPVCNIQRSRPYARS